MALSRYQAFISYSHSADGAFAPALQRGMQQLGRSWRKRRAMDVFRDETGLAVDPDLWGAITSALDASDWFVLLASPRAAASHWVGEEIRHCVASKGADRILIVLTEGTLEWDALAADFSADSDAAHPALRGLLTAAPRIVDMTWAREDTDLTLDNARFRADVARIVALIRDEPLQTTTARDARERRRTRTVIRSALGVLAVAALGTAIAAVAATTSWRAAAAEQTTAEEAARLALARELAAKSRIAEDPRGALALAAEAYALAPEPDHVGALLAAVSGVGAPLVDLPPLLPDGFGPADIRSSAGRGPDARLTLATGSGSVAVELATGTRWSLPGAAHYLMPDGAHAIGADGTVFALAPDGTADPVATVPPLATEPSFAESGELFVYRHDGPSGPELVVADPAGDTRSIPVLDGAACAGCSGDASTFAIAPNGSMVAARIAPAWSQTPARARLTVYAIDGEALNEIASRELAGVGGVRFTDSSDRLWSRDAAGVLVLAPETLEPVGEAMSISRIGPLSYAGDGLALAPVDDCAPPGVILPPTMATIAELPTDIGFTEGGCVDAAPPGSEPRWLLEGTWVRTAVGVWPTDAETLQTIACDALGGPVPRDEFAGIAELDHAPIGCSGIGAES